ncbi:hypothetical protein HQQ94_17600 [Shewanella sp. VB17]|uniref:hypothetical protein n=1 Tax=Shewanella sp. VB17 TaxID=2739432 RepID=UPI0015650198|nr:hypothetical protein [Shewanella sp. VB17]NRD74998.1 hypothetical protein [Shewanella sp. VB17]
MLWFIAAVLIATAVFKFAPADITTQTISRSNKDNLGHISFFILPILVLAWLLFTVAQGESHSYGAASFGFVLTACSTALAKLHKFIIPCAFITIILLIIGVTQT